MKAKKTKLFSTTLVIVVASVSFVVLQSLWSRTFSAPITVSSEKFKSRSLEASPPEGVVRAAMERVRAISSQLEICNWLKLEVENAATLFLPAVYHRWLNGLDRPNVRNSLKIVHIQLAHFNCNAGCSAQRLRGY